MISTRRLDRRLCARNTSRPGGLGSIYNSPAEKLSPSVLATASPAASCPTSPRIALPPPPPQAARPPRPPPPPPTRRPQPFSPPPSSTAPPAAADPDRRTAPA